jgi:hypothetical protein
MDDKDVMSKDMSVRHMKELIKPKKGIDQEPQRRLRWEVIQGGRV